MPFIPTAGPYIFCLQDGTIHDSKSSKTIAFIRGYFESEESICNGHLLAASWEMYETLKALRPYAEEMINDIAADIQSGNQSTSVHKELQKWNNVIAALNKAEGIDQ